MTRDMAELPRGEPELQPDHQSRKKTKKKVNAVGHRAAGARRPPRWSRMRQGYVRDPPPERAEKIMSQPFRQRSPRAIHENKLVCVDMEMTA